MRRSGRFRSNVPGAILIGMAALVAFCGVQERVTRAGIREYVERQRAAAAGLAEPVTVDEVMTPWVRRSLRQALLGAAPLLVAAALLAKGRRDA